MTTPARLIALLNALTVGDLDGLRVKLDEARDGCESLGQAELASLVAEAQNALRTGDLKTYRKRVETAVARLGHLK
ncbi:MAG TPA: hypothetical protein VMR65_05215 [Candidatus Sulfotelmatobacter sp.]|nr:hypothetical protein [Candidatus Sulfotelmatobacter sp.]